MTDFAWGDKPTEFFYSLTPERVLDAVEENDLICTGRCFALNSMENRVYEVELDEECLDPETIKTPSDRYRIAKFYRPGRWSLEQIEAEHQFLADLKSNEIPAIAPLPFSDGKTLHQTPEGIWYSLFPRVGGRAPEELRDEQLERVGRLLARIHNTGKIKEAPSRVTLNVATYGRNNLKSLLDAQVLPPELEPQYADMANRIFDASERLFEGVELQRIHGDCHLGNLLWNQEGPFFLDFDDMVQGPRIQDLWLLIPGRDEEAMQRFEILLQAYEGMTDFDRRTLGLIEPLRTLRMIHFSAWKAKRWEDPAFPRAFPDFGTPRYWSNEVGDLRAQLSLIMERLHHMGLA